MVVAVGEEPPSIKASHTQSNPDSRGLHQPILIFLKFFAKNPSEYQSSSQPYQASQIAQKYQGLNGLVYILLWPKRLNYHLLRHDLPGTNDWILITCSLLLAGRIGIQVHRNIQPHWYRKHVKSRNLSTALLISSYRRCLVGGKIRKLSITLLRLQSFERARLKAVVKTNAAWSRNQTHNMNTPYCRPRLKSSKGNGDTLISMKTSHQASSGLPCFSKTGPNCQLLCRARAKIAPPQLGAFLFDRWKIMIVAP